MPATPSAEKASFSSLLSLVPRQVFLTNRSNTMKQSSSDTKLLLHQSIARYLERSGFSKSLKKFRSEAQIQKDNLEGSIIDLEEMCLKYLEICGRDAKSNIDDHKEQVDGVHTGNKEEVKSKEKKKKKNKPASEFHANVEDNPLEPETTVTDKKGKDDVSANVKIVNGSETEKKSKDKKKKKDKTSNQGDAMEKNQNSVENVLKEDNIKASNKEVTDQEKKESKKRKRPISEENGDQVADKKADEETKRRRTENSDESKGVEKLTKTTESAPEKSNGETNGHLESAAEKSSTQKSLKKQQKESAE